MNVALCPRDTAVLGITRNRAGVFPPGMVSHSCSVLKSTPATTEATAWYEGSITGAISRATPSANHGFTAINIKSAPFTASLLSDVMFASAPVFSRRSSNAGRACDIVTSFASAIFAAMAPAAIAPPIFPPPRTAIFISLNDRVFLYNPQN